MKLRKKRGIYPSKTTVNLVFHEKTVNSPSRAIPAFLLFLVLLGVFVKYGVVNQIEKVSVANAALSQVQRELDEYVKFNEDYDEVKDRFNKYSDDYLDDSERILIDRVTLLDLLREKAMSRATVTNYSVSGQSCQFSIANVPLNMVSEIVNELEQSPLVYFIEVSTAATDSKDQNAQNGEQLVTANFAVTLAGGTN